MERQKVCMQKQEEQLGQLKAEFKKFQMRESSESQIKLAKDQKPKNKLAQSIVSY
jgi:hypothetical protein